MSDIRSNKDTKILKAYTILLFSIILLIIGITVSIIFPTYHLIGFVIMFSGLGFIAISYYIEHSYTLTVRVEKIFSVPDHLDLSLTKKLRVREESGLIRNLYIREDDDAEEPEYVWTEIDMNCNCEIEGKKCSGQYNKKISAISDKITLTCSQCNNKITVPISKLKW